MASAARDLRYQNYGAVNGSLAHDLDWAVRERELRHAGEVPVPREREVVREVPQVRARTKTQVQVRERQRVAVFPVLGSIAFLAMAVLVLLSYVQLTMLSTDTVALKSQLSSLETENVRLTAQYEQMFDLTTVQDAAKAAGMVKPSASQICYLDLSGGDTAVVYQKEETTVLSKVLTSVHHGVYSVVEYFD